MSDNPLLAGTMPQASDNPLLSGAMPPPPPPKEDKNAGLVRAANKMADQNQPLFSDAKNPLLEKALDFFSTSPQLLESTPDQNIVSRIASPIAKAGAGLVGFPAQVVSTYQETAQPSVEAGQKAARDGRYLDAMGNSLMVGPRAAAETIDRLLFQPGRDVRAKADAMDVQAANSPENAPALNQGANTLRRLSILPFAGPAIAEDANQIAQGNKAGGITDVIAQAVMMGLGAQGKGEADLKAARTAAINDFVDADLNHATQNGVVFDRNASIAKAKQLSTQDLIDTAQAVKEQTAQASLKAQALADAKSRMAQPMPEVQPTDVAPLEAAPEVKAKVSESNPAIPASDLKAAENQAKNVQIGQIGLDGQPTEGSPAPALLSDEERAHLEAKGFTVDPQGRLARLVQSRPSNPEAGQAALEPEAKPTPVFTPEPPVEPKGLLNAANVAPDIKAPEVPVSASVETAPKSEIVPGNNPTPEDIAALKAKHGIADVPSEKVGENPLLRGEGLVKSDLNPEQQTAISKSIAGKKLTSKDHAALSDVPFDKLPLEYFHENVRPSIKFFRENPGVEDALQGKRGVDAAAEAFNNAPDNVKQINVNSFTEPEIDQFVSKLTPDSVAKLAKQRESAPTSSDLAFRMKDQRRSVAALAAGLKSDAGFSDVPLAAAEARGIIDAKSPLSNAKTIEGNGQGLKTNLLKNRRTSETGAVRLDALTAAPAEAVAAAAKKVGEVASEGRGIAAAAGEQKPQEPLPKYAGSINLEKLATPDDVKRQVLDTYEANQKPIDKARKPNTSFEQTKKAALDLGWNEKDVIKAQKKGALDSAQIQAARQVTLAANEDVARLNKAYAADPSTQNLIARAEALSRSATVNQAMQGASAEAGRALNAHKILAEALRQSQTDTQRAMEIIRKGLGDKWEETQDAVTKALAAIPEGDTASMNKLIRNYSKFTTPNKVFAYYNANLLSGIQTNVKNHFLSRVVSSGMEDATRTVAGLLDPVMSKIQGRPREFYTREGAYSLLARLDGFQEGAENAMQILKHGVTESQAQDLGRSRRFEFTGWASPFNIPGRLAEASVALFKSMSVSGELKALAVRQALKEGVKGAALDGRIKEILANPSDEMIQGANAKADQINFTTQPGSWTKSFIKFRNDVPPMKFVTPFVNIPMNIMKAGVEFSPLGYLKLPRESAMGLFSKLSRDAVGAERLNYWKTPEAADAFARASIGTAISIYAASKYEQGALTGKAPAGAAERDQFLRQHPEYAVKVNGRWFKYTDFGPLMVPFMTAAAIKDAQQTKSNEGAEAVAYQSIGTLMNGALQQSFYKGMNDMANVFGGNVDSFKGSMVRTVAGYASGFIPGSGLLHSTKNMVDTKLRDPDGVYERIKAGIPWLSDTVPTKLNALGNETEGSRLSGIFGLGLRSSKVPDVDIEKELAKAGVAPSLPPSALKVGDASYPLDRDHRRELADLNGQARKQLLRGLFADQHDVTLGKGADSVTLTYSQMDEEQKAKAISHVVGEADKAAKEELINRMVARKDEVVAKPKKQKLMFVGDQ